MIFYRLANPLGLLFLIIPLLCLLYFIFSRFFIKKGVKITGVSEFEKDLSLKVILYYLSIFFIIFGMGLIAFSISKPQKGFKKEKISSQGIDIMLVLDVSGSMTTPDFLGQQRIEGAKSVILKFIDKRKGDRIGLVTFAENSLLKCPVTTNFELLKKIISKIYIDRTKQSSTSIGLGLASGINRLLQLKDNTNVLSKIIILVTDGINNSGEISPQTALELAIKTQIKVYTIGIGESEEVDIALLQDIAQKTNAKFFYAKNTSDLGNSFDEINNLEKHNIETYQYTYFKDIGYQFALIGSLFILITLIFYSIFLRRLG